MKRQNKGGSFEPPSVLCADDVLRPAWIAFARHHFHIYYLIRPGTPILTCDECSARVCPVAVEVRVVLVDLAREFFENDDLNAHYAPEHLC